jgi:hypothetical protein
MNKKRSPTGIKAEAAAIAKIEARATASIQRKKNITEVIPPDVTRAKAGAWLDLISPITEWAGLRGDELRHKRDLLRLQRESVLTTIVSQARRQLASENKPIKPVPNKFLVPFLERASLEDDDSELCRRWSDLLVSATTAYDPSMVRFASVLSEIGPGEVDLLVRLVRKCRGTLSLEHIEDVPHTFVHGMLERFIDNFTAEDESAIKLHGAIIDRFEYPGTVWTFMGIEDWDFSNENWSNKDEELASNLVSVGVLQLLDGVGGKVGSLYWYGRVYALTSFGLRFIKACDRQIQNKLAELELEFEKELESEDTRRGRP